MNNLFEKRPSPQQRWIRLLALLLMCATLLPTPALAQEDQFPPADIVNDDGGPVAVSGEVTYTNAFFTQGVASPLVILEDEAGFVDRNQAFLMPKESQTLGQITSDFYTSPFSYTIALPIEPKASLRDVDNDGEQDTGVMVYAVAYWTNTFGDPFLEERDLQGGGWSTAYASTRVSEDADTKREITGGRFLVYAPDDQQGFPSGFGEDGLLFTKDDPIVGLPQGYTVVNMDTDPFTFDRSREVKIDLIEPEGEALDDFSQMGYTAAFDAMIEKMRKEYAFTEYKGIDWDAMSEKFRPRFESAEKAQDAKEYLRALRDFAWSIPDGHIGGPSINDEFQLQTGGGLGMAIRDLTDGRTLVNYVLKDGPADAAGIKLKAEIIAINGTPVDEFVGNIVPWSSPFSTEHFRRLQQLRYALRSPVGTEMEITYKNPDASKEQTVTLTSVAERDSFSFSSFSAGLTGFETPVEYKELDDGYGYAKIHSFFDNEVLTVQLWERMIHTLKEKDTPGLIIDIRQNGGGNGFLADQMAAYFFDEPLKLGNTGEYDKKRNEFYFDPRKEQQFYLPSEDLRYHGKIAVLVGPNCASVCEFFSYDMTLQDRAAIVGQYSTAGLGGSVDQFKMPEDQMFQFTKGRAVDMNGDVHIEGKGVAPTVEVPVTEETLFSTGDPILEAAEAYLDQATKIETTDSGTIAVGASVTGTLEAARRMRYTLDVKQGDVISITVQPANAELATVLRLYDMADNLLLEGQPEDAGSKSGAAITELEIPADMALVVEVASADDSGSGDFTMDVTAAEKTRK